MENNTDFFPTADYKIPSTSNFMKFIEGENPFRVLSPAITGYVYFNNENKPIRSRTPIDDIPADLKEDGKILHFWAFLVWNYNDNKIQVLEVTQKGVMKTMQSYIKNAKWGNPREYDFIVTRSGSGLDTEYSISVNPKSTLEPEIQEKLSKLKVDLSALFEGMDPFKVDN